jgi:hypothetical protein
MSKDPEQRRTSSEEGISIAQQSVFPFLTNTTSEREILVSKWMLLVGKTLPAMAKSCGWPISQDHCFMRVCLDTSLGAPWHIIVQRPAIKHLTNAQLAAAIAVGEGLLHSPAMLDALNRQSINWRRLAGGAKSK